MRGKNFFYIILILLFSISVMGKTRDDIISEAEKQFKMIKIKTNGLDLIKFEV